MHASPAKPGKLSLVSIGIGDPDNITVKAQRTLWQADLIFGTQRVRDLFPDLVASKPFHPAGHGMFTPMQRRHMPEADALQLEARTRSLVREAVASGQNVVVVDYGDPLLYGPQSGFLKEFRDLSPEVVPGVSSFSAANAALATALTSSANGQSVILSLAKCAAPGYQGNDTLARLAQTRSTMALFTMKADLPRVVDELRQHYPGDTPVAIVLYAGMQAQQRVLRATLDTLLDATRNELLPFEHMIYVGDFLGHADASPA